MASKSALAFACCIFVAAVGLLAACGGNADSAATAPAGDISHVEVDSTAKYRTEKIAPATDALTDISHLPDGSHLVSSKGGWGGGTPADAHLHLYDADWRKIATPLTLSVCADAERGLVAVEASPDFATTGHIFVAWTPAVESCPVLDDTDPPESSRVSLRVSRFTMVDSRIAPSSELVIVDGVRASASAHLGGGLAFLADGTLVLGTGDGAGDGYGERPQSLDSLSGKLLRLNPAIANDSPPRDLVWARGFRNPFRIATMPDGQRILAADVGSDAGKAVEELTLVSANEDHGWYGVEGPGGGDDSVDPILWYRHATGCKSIIGGAFLPSEGNGTERFAFGDFVCGKIWIATMEDGEARKLELIAQLETGVSTVTADVDGSIYVTSTGPTGPESASVHRITRVP